ncbi:hypothetical protein K493DRAFT_101200 [Basidiobolus meristosporus CBS 931.73]|uniref:FATC domain-containing protein n=1 Tax=Basidiobolus meristosporus CBS 931.73 TaxID=1314790 RepID=A0A1Y1ZB07_9FUNG|nr:hypothetical protein K493DRAFT_101200 [Basidiobolus meristosporus CBS 931.73]|eukprot:ORY07439.1 hypothetical protein K493DRAFT_101200 [Basidiobolus meristosporus CBS 931.73]
MHKLMSEIGWLYTSMEEILNEVSGLVKVLYNQTNRKPEVRSIHQRFKAFIIVYSDFSYYFDTLFESLETLFGSENAQEQIRLSELNDNIQNIVERKTDAELALKKLFTCLYALSEDRDEPEIYRILEEDAGSGIDEWEEDYKEADNKSSANVTPGPVENNDINARNRQNYALNIIDRIRRKLNGLDGDKYTSMTVEEQVDYVYEQATSTDNLCSMYEGWTSWI